MTAHRKHVLLLGMQFPPARGSGVYRLRAWAHHLVNQGYDVTVLCTSREYWLRLAGSLDDELAARTDPRVRLVEVEIPHEHLIQDVRQMSWVHASFPKAFLEMHRLIQSKLFPEVYAPLIPVYVAAALKVHARHRVDLVLASGNPYSLFGVAWLLGKVLRKPYVVDYHDPWTLDVLKEDDAFEPGHPAFKWERRIVEGAARIDTDHNPPADGDRRRGPRAAGRDVCSRAGPAGQGGGGGVLSGEVGDRRGQRRATVDQVTAGVLGEDLDDGLDVGGGWLGGPGDGDRRRLDD